MFIDSIILNNFRAYKGVNQTSFQKNGKNVFVIAGNNGFGKTTLNKIILILLISYGIYY